MEELFFLLKTFNSQVQLLDNSINVHNINTAKYLPNSFRLISVFAQISDKLENIYSSFLLKSKINLKELEFVAEFRKLFCNIMNVPYENFGVREDWNWIGPESELVNMAWKKIRTELNKVALLEFPQK